MIEIYFCSGKNGTLPWHVGRREGKAIAESFGSFKTATDAVKIALQHAPQHTVKLPQWLDETEFMTQALAAIRSCGQPFRLTEAQQDEIEAERPGEHFSTYPYLY